ncbi:MAG TPA: hypothetical protein VGQ34_00080 [Sphingomicrobium sp.]|jgi:hypothetical protein|nr:hypothetical protein [Sphingomicrobium sp.]
MNKLIIGFGAIAVFGTSVSAVAQTVNERGRSQEHRIREGERSGQLSPMEARRLQYLEMRLHRTEARMRMENGGRLSRWGRRRLQQMADRDSAAIYRLKHNSRTY